MNSLDERDLPGSVPLTDQVGALLRSPMPLPIVQVGHPVLRRRAQPVDGQLPGAQLTALIEAMRTTMLAAPGVGLAAPQIGLPLALAVMQDTWPLTSLTEVRERAPVPFRVLINPRYEPVGTKRVAFYEGCLSVAGYQAVTPRWHAVRLTGTDETGAPIDEVLTGWPARIVQHETDHLAGRLYIDGAELRSLTGPHEAHRWDTDPSPLRAAAELGFDLP